MGKHGITALLVLIAALCVALGAVYLNQPPAESQPAYSGIPEEKPPNHEGLRVHFLNVGQGDSIFIELPDSRTMLIDAGESDQAEAIISYISTLGYTRLDYAVATHPHADHIGGMARVLESLPAKELWLSPAESTTAAFSDMLTAAEGCGAALRAGMAGDVIISGEGLSVEVSAPKTTEFDSLNNSSLVIKLTYGETRFLFTGDAEKAEEDGIWTNIKVDVLKIAHHGSQSSTSPNFLKKTEPRYAVISCGADNSYGHPAATVLERLSERGISVFRTDIQGTIVFTSDGKNISVNAEPLSYEAESAAHDPPAEQTREQLPEPPQDPPAENSSEESAAYVLNTNRHTVHRSDCPYVRDIKEKNKQPTDDLEGALAAGYHTCGRCFSS